MDSIFYHDFERDNFSDDQYAKLGRLLAYITTFEKDLKTLCMVLKVKYEPHSTDDYIMQTVKFFEAKIKTIGHSIKSLKIGHVSDALIKAKNNRNELIHNIAVGFFDR